MGIEQVGGGEMEEEGLCAMKRDGTEDMKAVAVLAPWEMVNYFVRQ